MMHDGSWVRLRKVAEDYDPSDRDRAYAYIRERQKDGESRHRPAVSVGRLEGHARAERNDSSVAGWPAVRAALSGESRAAADAGAVSLKRLVIVALVLLGTPQGVPYVTSSSPSDRLAQGKATLRVYLARHGQTDGNLKGIAQGWTDTPLNDTGLQQAATLAERLRGVELDAIYSSTLKSEAGDKRRPLRWPGRK